MKKYLKALLALMLALACVIACISCKKQDTTGGDNNGSNDNTNVDDSTNTDDTNKPGEGNEGGGGIATPPPSDGDGIEEETYRIRFVYSYTAKVVNDNGRTENKKEVKTVKSIYIDVDNNGLTADKLAEIAGLTYNGYSFVSWHAEWDTTSQTAKDAAVDFAALDKIDKDLTFYGERGYLAGPEAYWEIKYDYPEPEEEDVVPTTTEGDTTEGGEDEAPVEQPDPIGATLYIKGKGAMFDFANGNEIDVKWFKDQKLIHTVVFEDGITHVGSNSFKNFTKLTKVQFADSIVSIGDSAFLGIGLKKLTTPANLVRIEKNAFASTSLREVIFNDKLEVIVERVFYGSNKISSVVIPTSLKSIGNSAFHAGSGNGSHNLNNGKVFYLGDADGFKSIYIAMDNQPLAEFATIYYYIETPNNYGQPGYEEIIGNNWHYADEEAKLHPVQYCFTLSYTNEADNRPFYSIAVPARPQYDAEGNPILDDEGVPVLKGTITEDIYKEHKGIRYNGYTYESFSGGTAIAVGSVISGDISYNCVRGNILSEDGGIRFTFADNIITVYKDDTAEARIKADVEATMKSEIRKSLTADEITAIETDVNAKITNGEITLAEGESAQTYIDAAIAALVNEKFAAADAQADYEARVNARLEKAYRIWDFVDITDTGLLWNGSLNKLSQIQKVVIQDGVEYIGSLAFTSLTSITEITIPASVKEVALYAFDGCSRLKSVYYEANIDAECPTLNDVASHRTTVYSLAPEATGEAGSYWMEIGGSRIAWVLDLENGALTVGGNDTMVNFASADEAPWYAAKDSITSVTFADNIVSLGTYVLYGYEKVVDLSLPRVLTTIPESSLAGTGIINDTEKYNKGILVVDDHLLKVDATKRDEYFFETPFGLYTIADGAFAGCSSIKRIYITNTIKRINENAFPDSDFDYVFLDGDDVLWDTLNDYIDFGDATILLRSDKRPLDPETREYISGKYWRKIGKEYCVWGCAHVWTDWLETSEATCSKEGELTRYCIYDKAHREYQTIPCVDHVYGEYVSDNNATCVSPLTETAPCTNPACSSTSTREFEKPVLDENGQPVLNEDGTPKTEKVYGDCVFNEEDYVENGDRNCEKGMTATAPCANDGCTKTDTKDVADKPALGHIGRAESGEDIAWEDVPYTLDADSATCLKPYGTKSRTCARCAEYDGFDCGFVDTIEATEDDLPADYVAPACSYTEEKADAKYLASPATKTEPAKYYKSCPICGEASTTEIFTSGTALNIYDFESVTDVTTVVSTATNTVANVEWGNKDSTSKGNYAMISTDGENKVLEIGRNAVTTGFANLFIKNKNAKTGATHVIDTDIQLASFTQNGDGYMARIAMYNGAESFFTLDFYKVDDDTVTIKIMDDTQSSVVAETTVNIDTAKWYTLRVEYVVGEGKADKVTITLTDKATGTAAGSFSLENVVTGCNNATFESVLVNLRCSNANYVTDTAFYFDDMYIAAE